MKTLELANIINFINDIREEKTFLIKGFFKESKTPLIKKEKYIFDNIDEDIFISYQLFSPRKTLLKPSSLAGTTIVSNSSTSVLGENSSLSRISSWKGVYL